MRPEIPFRFTGPDGYELAYGDLGTGRPLILLHGFMAGARQWLDHGPAADLGTRRHHVVLPDLRGHGDSAGPHDPAAYPPDVLATDVEALIEHLDLPDDGWDLGGYSVGAAVAVRLLARGARPARVVLGGQGLASITRTGSGRLRHVLDALADGGDIPPGTPEAETARWIAQLHADPVALRYVHASLVHTTPAELRRITIPALVVAGDADSEHADGAALAAALPHARFLQVPGDHFTALASPELAAAVADFLG